MFTKTEDSEKYYERKLKEAIKKHGGMCIKLLSTITGLPDRMCLLPGGTIFFCEIKSLGKERSGRQKLIHKKLLQLGFKSYKIDSIGIINYLTGDDVRL